MVDKSMLKSPTFLVGTEKQRQKLDEFQRRDQHLTEAYQKNKPLCFSSRAYQETHPQKIERGHKDADATLASVMLLGVADGVSQLEEFGIDASLLPQEILGACEELAMTQLIPDRVVQPQDSYRGPVALLKDAYESTESLGSTTVLLAILDNSTKIHGKLHPMVAVLTIGDCELLMLRRVQGKQAQFEAVFHTEMQRIDGHCQTPLQLARVDERVDPDFDEDVALEVIERGSAVHCVSTYEGDIIVLGSDGVFDNLFLDEVVAICNACLPPPRPAPGQHPDAFSPTQPQYLAQIAQRVVEESHKKSESSASGHLPDTPIGRGGKIDDTSCVVAEVVEWTKAHSDVWAQVKRNQQWSALTTCGGIAPALGGGHCRTCHSADVDEDEEDYEEELAPAGRTRSGGHPRSGVSPEEEEDDDGDERTCTTM